MSGKSGNMMLLLLGSAASVAFAAPPTASVSAVSFSDNDLDRAELGGTISWTEPTVTTGIDSYDVYFATDASGGGRGSSAAASVTLATAADRTSTVLSQGTTFGSAIYVVVFTANVDGLQTTTPGSVSLSDAIAVITGLAFTDKDLDLTEIGGTVDWTLSGAAPVTGYNVYLADDANGANRVQVGTSTTSAFNIPADTAVGSAFYVCVYALSTAGEATQPSSVSLYDEHSPVRTLAFQDLDLDAFELGGAITWATPTDSLEVTQYVLTRSTSTAGAGRVSLGTAQAGATSYTMSADTHIGSYTHISVYSRSSLAEASTPVSISASDAIASVSAVTFTDTDQDVAELGGALAWTAPADTTHVAGYAVYLATTAAGASRSNRIGADSLALTRTLTNVGKSSYSYFTVYTKSSFTEQSTPAALAIVDVFTSTTYCDTFTCPTSDFHRGNSVLCTTGTCDRATCCTAGCRGTPSSSSLMGANFAPSPATCTDMVGGGSCRMQCASGYHLFCPGGGIDCNRVFCASSGGAYQHLAAECVRYDASYWNSCSAACGSGTQTRTLTCSSSTAGACSSLYAPTTQSCYNNCSWNVGAWGMCSFCGVPGIRRRSVQCSGGSVTCHGAGIMPVEEEQCVDQACGCFEDGRHDPMRPWGRDHSMSCGAQWWLIFWIIILSSLILCCCLVGLVFMNRKKDKKAAESKKAGGAGTVNV